MKHYGDITKIDGAAVPIVDVVTGGSPCQDLSVAGRRAGLQGERSGLFMEQVRVVKEMRAHDMADGRPVFLIRPRFMVWENVPGAFSSNGGQDFQAVLQEICRIVCEEAPAVPVPQNGWPKSGCLSGVGDTGCTFSIAWRLHDAQFWGVPQRRKRIALVADFGGLSAPEVLFERKGLRGDSEPGGEEGQGAAEGTERGVDSAICLQGNGIDRSDNAGCNGKGWSEGVSYTLNTIDRPAVMSLAKSMVYENHSQDSRYKPLGEVCETVNAKYGTGGNNQPLVVGDALPFDTTQVTSAKNWSNPHFGDPCHPLAAGMHPPAVAIGNWQLNQMSMAEQANTLDTMHDQQAVMTTSTVRRLTPLEYERLQGFPDGWTDIGEWTDSKGKKHKEADSPRYKALGNSIALPFWEFLARRICAQYERPVTMASLFDGIGGFPLAFSRCGASPVWASEIEEFPMAVTKIHFPEEAE